MIRTNRLLLFTLAILMLVLSVSVFSCSGATNATSTSTQESAISDPTVEPSATPEPNPPSEPNEKPSPTTMESTGEETASVGKTLLEERCTVCHDLSRVQNKSKTLEEWRTTVERMVGKGAKLNASEQEILIEYLAETYP